MFDIDPHRRPSHAGPGFALFTRVIFALVLSAMINTPAYAQVRGAGPPVCEILMIQPKVGITVKETKSRFTSGELALRRQLEMAAAAVRQFRLDEALAILSDQRPLATVGYRVFSRPGPDPSRYAAATEYDYYRQFKLEFKDAVVNSAAREIVVYEPPVVRGTARQIDWARLGWLRMMSEEIGHVAQNLSWDENRGRQSDVFARDAQMETRVRRTAERIVGSNEPRLQSQIKEADVYAYLIELYGQDLVPTWFATESGYAVRELIDETHGRAWRTPLAKPPAHGL